MVGHPADVRAALLDPASGALAALPRGGVLVDCTSSDPALARAVAAAARAKGCWAVDAPVSGGDVGAREGTLAILAGGDERVVAWLAPLLGRLGRATWMGAPGTGQSAKIANQIAVAGAVVGAAEAASFARAAGLDAATFMEAVGAGAAGSRVAEIFGRRMVERDFASGGFVEYMVKDLGMALGRGVEEAEEEEEDDDDDAKEKGAVVVLPGAALFQKLFLGMVANGDGKLGMQGVITVIERMNGLYFRDLGIRLWCLCCEMVLLCESQLLDIYKPFHLSLSLSLSPHFKILSLSLLIPHSPREMALGAQIGTLPIQPFSTLNRHSDSALLLRHNPQTLLRLRSNPRRRFGSARSAPALLAARASASSSKELVLRDFRDKKALKIISGLQNFDKDRVASVVIAADQGGATHVDIACDQELVKLAMNLTSLPICVSSVDPLAFAPAVEAGAQMIEIGNYDSFYELGIQFSPEQILKLTQETRRILPFLTLSVTIPHTLSLPDQVKLAELLEEEGADIIQTEGGKCSTPTKPGVLGLIEKATPTLAAAYSISRAVTVPVMCSSGLSAVTAPMALTAGAAGVGIGSAVNKLNDVVAMIAEVKSIAEALGLSTKDVTKDSTTVSL
ncbi:uncharacterized protein LOC109722101 [Ananas comosus]|uniref:Uncharacterized protein ycf23 n=2 Tax=Ananas comosus TaxID=4615 RepID=A0A6P5GBS8_ANACO|nr:uncharacterized protein LOC109722101 [Ananas comosus]